MLSPKKLTETFSEHYVARMDLGEDPFDRNFQSNYFYQGGERRKTLEQLVHYGRFSKQPLLLVGETGSGKDKLISEVTAQLQAVMDCCRISVELLSTQEAILSALAERLGIKLDHERSLQSFVAALTFTLGDSDEVEPLLVIVEKVQLLSAAELEFLFELQAAAQGAMHLLLVADELTATLEVFCGDGKDALKTIGLRPLTQQETIEYVMSLLESVGYAGDMPLTKEQWQELHQNAKGNFYAINEWMPELLMGAMPAQDHKRKFGIPLTHVIAVSILMAAIIVAYLYKGEQPTGTEKARQQLTIKPQLKAAYEKNKAVSTEPSTEINTEQVQEVLNNAPEDERTVDANSSGVMLEPDEKVELTAAQQNVAETTAEYSPDLKEKETETETESQPEHADKKTALVLEEKPSEIAAESIQQVAIDPVKQRLLSMPPSAYVLQLLGARSEQRAKGFVQQYISQLPLSYFETTLKGSPWFVVVVGPYDNRSKALAAIKTLPKSLQQQKPWVRAVAGIQAEIAK